MANLLATKPLNLLMEESRETGEHSLKRTLGVFQLTGLGRRRNYRRRHFVMVGLGAQYAGPGLTLSFVLSGLGCTFAGPLLMPSSRGYDPAWPAAHTPMLTRRWAS